MKNILLVDDEEFILTLTESAILKNFDCNVVKAQDGMEAYNACMAIIFDMIITDQRMPNLSGSDFILKLRNDKNQNKDVPIVFMSAFVAEAQEHMKEFNNVFFLSKPAKFEEIKKYIKRILQIHPKNEF